MFRFFNTDAIAAIPSRLTIAPSGFRFAYVRDIFKDDVYDELVRMFPDVTQFNLVDKISGGGHKRFYVGPNYSSSAARGCPCDLMYTAPIWQAVMREAASPEFMSVLSGSSGISFNSLRDFGFTYGNEGCLQEAHIDGAIRPNDPNPVHGTFASLLFINKEHGGSSGTCVYDVDRTMVLGRADDLRNSMFFFEQHPASWHGFPTVPSGEERHLISLAYGLNEPPILLKTSPLHPLICKRRWKMVAKRFLK